MFDVDSKVKAVLRGELEFNRFSRQEQNGSRDLADRLLWTGILLAERELAESDARASGCRKNQANGDAPSPYRFLEDISQPLPATLTTLKDLLRRSRNMAEGVRTSLGSYLIKSKTDRRGLRACFVIPRLAPSERIMVGCEDLQ